MKKDIRNVVVTFGLIGIMLAGGSFLYTKKILAEEAVWNAESTNEADVLSEHSKIQEEILANQAEEARLLAEKDVSSMEDRGAENVILETETPNQAVTNPVTTSTFAHDITKKQAEYQSVLDAQQAELKKKQIQADQLADQKAADASAQQLRDKKGAAEKARAVRASRRSRAS